MAKFKKKPIIVGAVQITESTFNTHPNDEHIVGVLYDPVAKTAQIKTAEGTMTANLGDWIIRGVEGELYPCKPDIFDATYEFVDPRKEQTEISQTDFLLLIMAVKEHLEWNTPATFKYAKQVFDGLVKKYDIKGV